MPIPATDARPSSASPVIVCPLNISEGRRESTIDSVCASIAAVPGAFVLGAECDADHNRAVITFAGAPDSVFQAAFAAIRQAAKGIDMDWHHGEHPRIGAADVVPFVPGPGASMAECVAMARSLGARVGDELGLPVYLYAESALRPNRRSLADIRRGGYESLRERLPREEGPPPDFGPRVLGKAGACVIGARPTLIAFNVFLDTDDVAVAKAIARKIRASSGGLPHVMALGLRVRGLAQASMNLTDYRATSIPAVVSAIRREAATFGVEIRSSEIIGLLPRDALSLREAIACQVENYEPGRILEWRLRETGLLVE